ncbi:BCCT family transporter [Actinomyces sp. B33]|uniref:BCCT family transporter n=1 Tax=Actinomyces sp. B33 TaxID=2942131 RepID=UPI0023418A32|nr:BCCT family transporter [Actinomyces sp. B33]MDC4232385.1 BCCT family transporter [Actinomyces sp. B33]
MNPDLAPDDRPLDEALGTRSAADMTTAAAAAMTVSAPGTPAPVAGASPDDALPDEADASVSWGVVVPAVLIALALIAPVLIWPSSTQEIVSAVSSTVVNDIGWYYTLIVVGFVAFSVVIAASRYGDIVLGSDDDEPEYSRTSWFAMLFAAGMGIGLVFWGVAEPLSHYVDPVPGTAAGSESALAQSAMNTTFLHWGLSAWAIYVVVGVSIAYMSHRRGRPVSIRWILEPLLGERVKGRIGDVIDIAALVGTLFGVATSLGFGASQFTAGLEFQGVLAQTPTVLLLVVLVISALAALSVASGLDVGIKILSNGNLVLAAVLMVAVLVLGEPLFVMREFVQSLGQYIQNFIPMSFRTLPYQGVDGEAWLGAWTTYYWGWWMSWSPFVGVFIARISKGRTVREFVVGVLGVPTLVTFLWFTVMGGTALFQQIYGGADLTADDQWTTTALFAMVDRLPGGAVLAGLFMLLLVVFFVTSSDSASFVLGMLSSGGAQTPPLGIRLFWAAFQGVIAAVLLWAGAGAGDLTAGLGALQVLSVLTALPFSIVMVGACVAMTMAFSDELDRRRRAERRLLRERITSLVEETVEAAPRRPHRRWIPAEPLYTAPRRRRQAPGSGSGPAGGRRGADG